MAKQTFTTGQVLTAAQMTSLQQTAMLGGSASAKVASYTLVAADAGTTVSMSNAGATTITVNTGLFAAGDTVTILNVGAGTCTITAGTATVSKPSNATLALVTSAGGVLYFTATGAATFLPFDVGAGASAGKSFTLIGSAALTGAATVTVSGIVNQDVIFVHIAGGSTSATGANITMQLNSTSANYAYFLGTQNNGTTSSTFSASTSAFQIGLTSGNAASVHSGGIMILGAATTGVKNVIISGGANQAGSAVDNSIYTGTGYWNNTATVTSVSLIVNAGNWDAGTMYVYGAS
jgi:hypothetical protein